MYNVRCVQPLNTIELRRLIDVLAKTSVWFDIIQSQVCRSTCQITTSAEYLRYPVNVGQIGCPHKRR